MSNPRRVELEPAFVLHTRAYRETSQLLEVFTLGHGRVGLVARGARRPKSVYRGILNPFQPLRISWSGRGELLTLREADVTGPAIALSGDRVLSGFYANELILKFLERADPHPDLFAVYAQTLARLGEGFAVEALLRIFEIELLAESGYALNLMADAETGEAIDPAAEYEFFLDQGAVRAREGVDTASFSGRHLLAIARQDFDEEAVRRTARRLLRGVINHHLGNRVLHTRQIAASMKQRT